MIAISDYRAVQTPVRDQKTRSACVGFAVAAAHEWMRPGSIRSVEDVLWAAHQIGGDPAVEATSVEYALSGLDRHRHALEHAWPFETPPFPAARPTSACDSVNQTDFVGWRRIPKLGSEEVAEEVAKGTAVILTLGVVPGAWRPDGQVDAVPGRKAPGCHAVLAVGVTQPDQAPSILVKNSWGPAWGDSGYGYVSGRYLEGYAVAGHVLDRAA